MRWDGSSLNHVLDWIVIVVGWWFGWWKKSEGDDAEGQD